MYEYLFILNRLNMLLVLAKTNPLQKKKHNIHNTNQQQQILV